MGIFGGAKNVGRTREAATIDRVLREQQQQQISALEQERKAVNEVAERERQMLGHIATLQTQLQEREEEVERSRKAEEDLHRALRLAAERLANSTGGEGKLRAELEETRAKLIDTQMQVQHLRARLYGEKGVRIDDLHPLAGGADSAGLPKLPSRGDTQSRQQEDAVITSLVTGAVPAARDGASVGEERTAAARHAREQLKRLLHFVKLQLSADLDKWRGHGDSPPTELTAAIGKQRALASKLEGALNDLTSAGGGGDGQLRRGRSSFAAGAAGGGGFAIRVQGDSLPRSVAVNDSAIRPILLASGPAARWVVREHDAPPVTPSKAAAKAAAAGGGQGGDDEAVDTMEWTAGETLMLVVEAVDEYGELDTDFDAVVLVDCEAHVSGRGLVRVTRGRGYVPLVSQQAGLATVRLLDGGFSAMVPPAPLAVTFKGGAAAAVAFTPEAAEATAGDAVPVLVEVRDRFGNVATEVSCEAVLAASHGASFGDGAIAIENGVATVPLTSEVAAMVEVSVLELRGCPEVPDHGLSGTAHVQIVAGAAACVQLEMPSGSQPLAGVRTRLLVTVADKHGNAVASSNLAADLVVVAGKVGHASVERGGQVAVLDGRGEVWVVSESSMEPTQFYMQAAGGGSSAGALAIRHTEEEPFVGQWYAGTVAQFGLYLPEVETPARVGGERMVVGVRTEDSFGNPTGADFEGRVLVISHSKAVRFCGGAGKVLLKKGDGRLEIESDSTDPFQLSLQDIARTGLRTASVLRTAFRPLPGGRAVFGDVGGAARPVGFPYPLPLLVLDRLGNVADDFEGDIPVTMSGAARVAGRAPEIFRVVRGRSTLPVLTTIAEAVTFTLGDEALIDAAACQECPALSHQSLTAEVHFCAADAQRLVLSVTAATDGTAAAAGGGGASISQIRAGEEVLVSVKALDAFNNVVPHIECTVLLEADLRPVYDDALTNTLITQQAREPPQRYLLTLSNGEASQCVPSSIAGDLTLRLVQPSVHNIDLSSQAKLRVAPASAVSIDVVNMPEAGKAGTEFQLMVRALDPFGNVDETFEREVALDSEGAPPSMVLQNGGRVRLVKGIGKCSCTTKGGPEAQAHPADLQGGQAAGQWNSVAKMQAGSTRFERGAFAGGIPAGPR